MIPKLETGVPGLDTLTHGGIPRDRATLIVGRSGTGKTILGLQKAVHLAQRGYPTVVVGIEETATDLHTTALALGLPADELIGERKLAIIDVTRPMEGPTLVSGDYDIGGLLTRVEQVVAEIDARVVVIDSITALFSPRPPESVIRSQFLALLQAFRRLNLTSILLAEAAPSGDVPSLQIEDYLCDVVVVLRNAADGQRRRRSLEINKYRRSAHYKGEYPCTITKRGLAIFPLDAQDHPERAAMERYSSGLAGLDEMTHGGWFRNAIMLVRGPTGSGKTMLAGLYARAGAARGERVVYYGFEEPRPTLLQNFEQIGMSMSEVLDRGTLVVQCRYPEATSLEDLLIDLRVGLEEFKPTLVVFDSISSIEHATSEKGFRQFMIGLASLLREHGRSALLTQTVEAGETAMHTVPYLSTIADAILALDYSPQGFELNRTMRVLKMRGSAHETHPYRLTIQAGGLRVDRIRQGKAGTSGAGSRAARPRRRPLETV